MFKRKSEEEIREEVDPNLNENVQAGEETVTGSAPEGAETPGTGNGEGTAGNAAEEVKPEETAEETLEDVQAKLTATAALLKTKEEEATEIKNRLLRLQADFDNFRRRNTAEREELATYVTISVVNKFLQILDNFERAEAAAENATDVQSVVDGMAGIQKQFVKTLEDLGVRWKTRPLTWFLKKATSSTTKWCVTARCASSATSKSLTKPNVGADKKAGAGNVKMFKL